MSYCHVCLAPLQGYCIGLQQDTVALLRPLAAFDDRLRAILDMPSNASPVLTMMDASATPILQLTDDKTPFQLVHRGELRRALMAGLDDVRFGKQLRSYALTADGVVAKFADGTEEQLSLLIGADGARSAVRSQLSPSARYADLGLSNLAGQMPSERAPAALAQAASRGLVRALGPDGYTLMTLQARASHVPLCAVRFCSLRHPPGDDL